MILHLSNEDVYCLLDALIEKEDQLREMVLKECDEKLEARYYTTINLYDRIMSLKENTK